MRKWKTEQGVIISEQEILDKYWNTWSEAMWLTTQDPIDINQEDCIADFLCVTNAEEIYEECS